jgi:hypothetical protein
LKSIVSSEIQWYRPVAVAPHGHIGFAVWEHGPVGVLVAVPKAKLVPVETSSTTSGWRRR